MSKFTDFFWPILEDWRPHELSQIREETVDDIDAIRSTDWSALPDLALAEAHRLSEVEDDRRRTAEAKATTYLLFAGALVPVLTYFESAVWEGKVGTAPKLLSIPLLGLAVCYLVAAGVWAFRAVGVSTFQQLDVAELVSIWREENPLVPLIQETLVAARMNRGNVNRKVSCIKMAQAFMLRTFIVFGALVVIEAGWETCNSLWNTLRVISGS